MSFTQETAEILGLQALGWLVGNDDLRPIFLNSSGASESEMRERATDPVFLGAVLDFLMMDDAWVIRFCDESSLSYDRIMAARAVLPGGEQINWT